MIYLSLFLLAFISVSCIFGVLYRRWDDNILQRIGMGFTCIGTSAKFQEIWETQQVNPYLVWGHAGMALFILGTAFKVYLRRPGNAERFHEASKLMVRRMLGVAEEA